MVTATGPAPGSEMTTSAEPTEDRSRKFVDSNRLKFPGMPLSGQHASGRQTAHPNHHLPEAASSFSFLERV